jgi:hypothetical protein
MEPHSTVDSKFALQCTDYPARLLKKPWFGAASDAIFWIGTS